MNPFLDIDLLQLAGRTPVVIDTDGRVYFVGTAATPGRSFTFEAHPYGLVPFDSLWTIERRHVQLNQAALAGSERQADVGGARADSNDAAPPEEWAELACFIWTTVVPALAAAGASGSTTERPLTTAKIQRRTPRIRRAILSARCRYLSFLAGTCFLGGRAYRLEAAPQEASELVVRIGRRRLVPGTRSRSLDEVSRQAAEALAAGLRQEMRRRLAPVPETRDDEPPVVIGLGPGMVRQVSLAVTLFENEWGGVRETPSGFVVFAHVPAFAVQEGPGHIYGFPSTRVGLVIRHLLMNRVLLPGCVTVLDSYAHPFVSASNSICMVQDERYYRELHARPAGEAVLHLLNDARHTLMFGFRHDSRPFRALGGFTSNLISESEAAARKLPVFRLDDAPAAIEGGTPR